MNFPEFLNCTRQLRICKTLIEEQLSNRSRYGNDTRNGDNSLGSMDQAKYVYSQLSKHISSSKLVLHNQECVA